MHDRNYNTCIQGGSSVNNISRLIILVLLVTYSLVAVGANCFLTTPIGPDQTITASLDGSECLVSDIDDGNDFTYYDLYSLTLTSAKTLVITMESNYFDTFLALFTEELLSNPTPSTLIATNDDADLSTTNSEITVDLGPGNYIVFANSLFDFETGPYVLKTMTVVGANVDLGGTIKTINGQDICAMVLASGQYMFSCNPIGIFSLTDLPLEINGTVKRQIYADGFFPKIDILAGSSNEAVVMTQSGACPSYNVNYDPAFVPGSAGKSIYIAGKVLVQDSQIPICAMVLANGQYTFSCDGTGSYALKIPLDTNGQFKLQVYADGFAPTIQKFDEFKTTNNVRMARAVECQ